MKTATMITFIIFNIVMVSSSAILCFDEETNIITKMAVRVSMAMNVITMATIVYGG